MAQGETGRAIETVFRIERARLIASLARMTRDVDRAEELAQDALLIALAEWPKSGVPANPGAWLTAAAKRRAVDGFRRAAMQDRKHAEIGRDLDRESDMSAEAIEAAIDDELGDERRRPTRRGRGGVGGCARAGGNACRATRRGWGRRSSRGRSLRASR